MVIEEEACLPEDEGGESQGGDDNLGESHFLVVVGDCCVVEGVVVCVRKWEDVGCWMLVSCCVCRNVGVQVRKCLEERGP
jgi:hypothetical protein